jgi:hypothetical protein
MVIMVVLAVALAQYWVDYWVAAEVVECFNRYK